MLKGKLLSEKRRRVKELREEKTQLDEQTQGMKVALAEMRDAVELFKKVQKDANVVNLVEYEQVTKHVTELEKVISDQDKKLSMLNISLVSQASIIESKTMELEGKFDCALNELQEKIVTKVDLDGGDEKGPELVKDFFVEKKLNGYRCVGHVSGKQVRLYSDQQKDITEMFPGVVLSLRDCCDEEAFIVDGELVPYDAGGKCLGRRALAKFVNKGRGGEMPDDSGVKFVLFDCLYYNGCMMDAQEYERKKVLLDNFKVRGSIDVIKPYLVQNRSEMEKAIDIASKGGVESEGCIIKAYGGVYEPGKDSRAWVKYRLESPLNVVVLERFEKGG